MISASYFFGEKLQWGLGVDDGCLIVFVKQKPVKHIFPEVFEEIDSLGGWEKAIEKLTSKDIEWESENLDD